MKPVDEFRLDFGCIFDQHYDIVFNEILRATDSIEFASSSTVEILTNMIRHPDGATKHYISRQVSLAIKVHNTV